MRPLHSHLCVFEEFALFIPIAIDLQRLLLMSRQKKFPRYFRPDGQKSEPVFWRDEVAAWLRERYSEFFPEHIAALDTSSFITKAKRNEKNK